ncbi:MAG TPA: ribosomal protein S18-alanine N-acetyltransferase [Rhodanobacteraceae bacterium]|jgi:ribosomal-protein-alanine N-acetyltransferase|nr:ribosomal protein S18-alanine N-acetyltransferase [Rhodanobacteraceae bacterium]
MVAVAIPSPPEVRAMQRDDLAQVTAIEASAYEFPWAPGIFRDCLQAGHGCWVLAGEAGVIGYGILSAAAGEAHVLNLCVAPAHQGHGHGRRLLRRLLDTARWHGAERVFLEVRPSNRAAQALYEHSGFNEIARRPNYYPTQRGREDAIVMALELLPPDRTA